MTKPAPNEPNSNPYAASHPSLGINHCVTARSSAGELHRGLQGTFPEHGKVATRKPNPV